MIVGTGVATAEEIGVETFEQRLRDELRRASAVIADPILLSAGVGGAARSYPGTLWSGLPAGPGQFTPAGHSRYDRAVSGPLAKVDTHRGVGYGWVMPPHVVERRRT
jgi:hypothetical protein